MFATWLDVFALVWAAGTTTQYQQKRAAKQAARLTTVILAWIIAFLVMLMHTVIAYT